MTLIEKSKGSSTTKVKILIIIGLLVLHAKFEPIVTIVTEDALGSFIFSYERPDRSGAAIHDMLMCHAYAFSRGLKYGGSCPESGFTVKEELIKMRKNLLKKIGLDFPVLSECPKGAKVAPIYDYHYKPELFSPEYIDHLRSTSKSSVNVSFPRAPRITLHIRRGDVEPCGKNGLRYLPNSHFLTLIHRYREKLKQRMSHTGVNYTSEEIQVTIFSESSSFESFDVFRDFGYEVVLDGALQRVWKSMIFGSDVAILSISSFSVVPGILSLALPPDPTIVVYTPFWHPPLAQFDNVGELYPELMKSTEAELNNTCGHAVRVGKINGWT